MKLEFFKRAPEDQATIIREVAAQRGVAAVLVEKDFWVSWTLAVLFAHPEFSKELVFKGALPYRRFLASSKGSQKILTFQ